jgi:hypothetical protein
VADSLRSSGEFSGLLFDHETDIRDLSGIDDLCSELQLSSIPELNDIALRGC